jgi:hypothetical protein
VSDITTPTPRNPRGTRRNPIPLDDQERKVTWFAVYIAAALAALEFVEFIRNVPTTNTVKAGSHHSCPSGYHLVLTVCEKSTHIGRSSFLWLGGYLVVAALAITLFNRRNRRSGVVVAAIMLGFPLGTAGVAFFFLGAWLIMRAFRVQRYGDPTFAGSSRRAREVAEERRANRKAGKSLDVTSKSAPTQSKRYTPKQSRRRK